MCKEKCLNVVATLMQWSYKGGKHYKKVNYHVMGHPVITFDVTTAPSVKGITHCLLPECNNLVWPFMNYCGKSHADLGKQRGLQRKLLFTDG